MMMFILVCPICVMMFMFPISYQSNSSVSHWTGRPGTPDRDHRQAHLAAVAFGATATAAEGFRCPGSFVQTNGVVKHTSTVMLSHETCRKWDGFWGLLFWIGFLEHHLGFVGFLSSLTQRVRSIGYTENSQVVQDVLRFQWCCQQRSTVRPSRCGEFMIFMKMTWGGQFFQSIGEHRQSVTPRNHLKKPWRKIFRQPQLSSCSHHRDSTSTGRWFDGLHVSRHSKFPTAPRIDCRPRGLKIPMLTWTLPTKTSRNWKMKLTEAIWSGEQAAYEDIAGSCLHIPMPVGQIPSVKSIEAYLSQMWISWI